MLEGSRSFHTSLSARVKDPPRAGIEASETPAERAVRAPVTPVHLCGPGWLIDGLDRRRTSGLEQESAGALQPVIREAQGASQNTRMRTSALIEVTSPALSDHSGRFFSIRMKG
jgi:hypothetical protein